jgi:sialate O-acetylesterase
MQISSKTSKIFLHDVMVGEVWLCSGQSNMAFELQRANGACEDIAVAANPRPRLFTVPANSSLEPLKRVKGGRGASPLPIP